jgi:hypothetical protein
MGLGSRYLRVGGRHRKEAAPVVGFRFRYRRAVEYGGTVGAAGAIGRAEAPILVRDLEGEAASWHDDCRLARAFAIKPAHHKWCAPAGVGA